MTTEENILNELNRLVKELGSEYSVNITKTSPPKSNLSKRDFHGEEFYLACLKDEEEMRALRNRVSKSKTKPTEEDITQLRINKPWEQFYGRILYP